MKMKKAFAIILAIQLCMAGVLPAMAEQTHGSAWLCADVLGEAGGVSQPEAKDDFHTYVNHEWLVNAVIQDGKSDVSSFSQREEEVKAQIKELLRDETQPSHEAELARNLYAIAQDMDRRNELGMSQISARVKEVEAVNTLDELSAYLASEKYPFGYPMISAGLMADFADSNRYIVVVAPASLSLKDAAEYDGDMSEQGKRYDKANHTTFTALYANMTGDAEKAETIYADMLAWEGALASAQLDVNASHQPDYYSRIYNVCTEEELVANSPAFPLAAALDRYYVSGSPVYMLTEPEWLKKLNELYTEENLSKMKAYLVYQMLLGACPFLDQKCIDISNEWDAIALGVSGASAQEETNYQLVNAMLPMQIGRMYTDACFSEETRQDVVGMIDEVLTVYRARLAKADWMTETTRDRAIGKLNAITIQVGYPATWPDVSQLVIEKDDTLLDAVSAINANALRLNAAKVGGAVDKTEWQFGPQTVNAFYDQSGNSINILAGILGGAFYTPGGAREANLAGIGTVIGHEITHAFDENGSQFDAQGNMVSWWTDEDRAAFRERTGKVSAYMSAIEPWPGLTVDGATKVNEEVADLGGLSCMLEIASGIENFDYRLFFESYAKLWRQQTTRESFENHVLFNVHPEGYLRTNVGVQQFEEFYQTYGVQEGDGMYLAPEDRLHVW